MKFGTFVLMLALLLPAGIETLNAADQAARPNTLTDADKADGWKLLFDGTSLAGWKASENPESFTVRDGVLVAHGKGTAIKGQAQHPKSHLFYVGPDGRAKFTNFEFQADIKMEPGSNGGVYFHTAYVTNTWPQIGCEVQLDNIQADKHKTGSLYAIQDVAESPTRDNEWFNLHIVVRGKHVIVKVDGKTVVDWTQPADFVPPKNPTWSDRRLGSGTFALQAHDDKSTVSFKNIRARPLAAEKE